MMPELKMNFDCKMLALTGSEEISCRQIAKNSWCPRSNSGISSTNSHLIKRRSEILLPDLRCQRVFKGSPREMIRLSIYEKSNHTKTNLIDEFRTSVCFSMGIVSNATFENSLGQIKPIYWSVSVSSRIYRWRGSERWNFASRKWQDENRSGPYQLEQI